VLLASIQGSIVGIALIAMGKGQPGPEDERRGTSPRPTEADATFGSVIEDEEDWIPPKNSVPFGPFLVAGALEWLWLGDLFVRWIPTLSVFR
jgi:leader peptidase (prepilin peptidase)/N-methyltransferase